MEFDRFLDIIRALHEAEVDYVLVGGVAVNLHGIVRATEDVDLFIRPGVENVEKLKRALRALWDDPDIETIDASEFDEYATLRYGPPEGELLLDFLTRIGTAFSYDDLDVATIELDGVPLRVATPETLVRMKRGTVRPIDRADVEALTRTFDLGER